MKRNTIFAMALVSLSAMIACTGQANEEAEKYREGWELVWEDNMEDSSSADAWARIPQGELPMNRYMSNNDALYVYQENNLVLRGLANNAGNGNIPFLTGGIFREGLRENEIRRIEVRARAIPVPGAVSFISLIPTDGTSNVVIDIMERYGVDEFMYQSITSEYTTTEGMPDNPPSSALVG